MLKRLVVIVGVLAAGFAGLMLTSANEVRELGRVVAYRGGGQLIDYQNLASDGCSARSVVQSDNLHVENTAESIGEAFRAGVDVIHINIRRSKDNAFVLFHDATIDCATNGSGEVREATADLLYELDAGYGYTFDGGERFPFRGKGYRISNLASILNRYPDKEFWLNIKTNNEADFAALYTLLTANYADRLAELVIISSEKGERWFRREAPGLRTISVGSTRRCLKQYMLYGWSGLFPEVCANRPILIPPENAASLWGYPRRFAALAQDNGSRVYLWTKHTPLAIHMLEIENGIGVVTGDIHGVKNTLRSNE